jgi:hypothetical protein
MVYCASWGGRQTGIDTIKVLIVRIRIVGAIGVIWGGLILARALFVGGPEGSGTYRQGQVGALIFAALLVIVGGYYLVKGNNRV